MEVLRLENVCKSYKNTDAVKDISFAIEEGTIFGLLGPNGAGKTSLIRIITGITGADTGDVYLNGQMVTRRRPEKIGYLPEERGLYTKMKVGEQLLYLSMLKGMSRKDAMTSIKEWLERFQIANWWNKKVTELSKGMQQKLQFISTVVHRPKLIILDEPFTGLDPINTNLIKSEIRRLNEQGTSIIFSTHRMEQVEEICEKIVLINNGIKVLDGRVNDVKERYKEHIYRIEFRQPAPHDLNGRFPVVGREENTIWVHVKDENEEKSLLKLLVEKDLPRSFQEVLPSLNEIFIRIVENRENE